MFLKEQKIKAHGNEYFLNLKIKLHEIIVNLIVIHISRLTNSYSHFLTFDCKAKFIKN